MGGAVVKPCGCHRPPFQHRMCDRDRNGCSPSLGSPVSPHGGGTCVPWDVKGSPCAQSQGVQGPALPWRLSLAFPLTQDKVLCQEHRPHRPPGACSGGVGP